jgi:hypothetical protein
MDTLLHAGLSNALMAAALALPAAAVALHWQIQIRRLHYAPGVYGGLDLRHAGPIAAALRYEFLTSPVWHGFAFALLLLPLLAFQRRLRPVAIVLALQLSFYLYVYFSFRFDPSPLVIASFDRLELHLLPPLLLASGIALDPLVRRRAAPAPPSAVPAIGPQVGREDAAAAWTRKPGARAALD